MISLRLLPLLLLQALLLLASPSIAADLHDEVTRLLDLGARVYPGNFENLQAQYQALAARSPGDARLDFAWAVILVNHRKHVEALPLLSARVRANPTDLETACWYTWCLIQCRRYDDALSAVSHVGSRIADERLASEDARRGAAELLGQFIGYFERVKPGATTPEKIGKVKNQLLSNLTGHELAAFDAGRAAFAASFSELQTAQEKRFAERSSSIEQQQNDALQSLEGNRQRVSEGRVKLDSTAEKIQDASRELSVLQRQIASLSEDRTRLSAQSLAVEARLSQLYLKNVDLGNVDAGTNSNGRPLVQFTQTRIDVADALQAQQLAMALTALQKQAFDMDRRLVALNTRARQLQGTNVAESQTAAQSEADIRKASKRADALEKQARRLEADKPKAVPLTPQMRSLSTYVPFPYEQQQARVLAWFDGK